MTENDTMKLTKKIIITGTIELLTGMLIGGADTGIMIGGVDKSVVRNPVDGRPYIPGSSLKGKIRSLLEKADGKPLSEMPGTERIKIHRCSVGRLDLCPICTIFGVPAEYEGKRGDTRLIVRDGRLIGFRKNGRPFLEEAAIDEMARNKNLPLKFTDVKTEVVIDRITSQALPRTFERVPAGTFFSLDLVVNIFEEDKEEDILKLIFRGLELVQDDYLGGQGSRGYGQVRFRIDRPLRERVYENYTSESHASEYPIPKTLVNNDVDDDDTGT